mmetsp:Transcript_30739/g.74931  ORF Transcript_30739/g.74931 Transcript_30739/m.74931 type:complete len:239 (+) Transcript_30739:497-1213(+)
MSTHDRIFAFIPSSIFRSVDTKSESTIWEWNTAATSWSGTDWPSPSRLHKVSAHLFGSFTLQVSFILFRRDSSLVLVRLLWSRIPKFLDKIPWIRISLIAASMDCFVVDLATAVSSFSLASLSTSSSQSLCVDDGDGGRVATLGRYSSSSPGFLARFKFSNFIAAVGGSEGRLRSYPASPTSAVALWRSFWISRSSFTARIDSPLFCSPWRCLSSSRHRRAISAASPRASGAVTGLAN